MDNSKEKKNGGNRNKATFWKIGFFVFLAAFLCIGAVSVKRYLDRKAASDKLAELAESTRPEESSAPAPTETPTPAESSAAESAESKEEKISYMSLEERPSRSP